MKFNYEEALERGDALRTLCEAWGDIPVETETVLLSDAFGRVVAEDVYAQASIPVVRSSKRDGIAVKSEMFAHGVPDGSSWQRGVDYAQADTGDDFPDEFDAVVAVEEIERLESGGIRFTSDKFDVRPGDGVNQSGSIVKSGSLIVSAGTRLTPELVAACAVGCVAQVEVRRRARVAFIPTGSELVPWGSFPERGQNIEANSLLVRGMLEEWGAQPIVYPMVRDAPEKLEAALNRALEAADIVLINGGSSRGEEDYNSCMLQKRATYFRHGVRAVPGRPIGMSIIEGKPVVNVPGPVLAAFLAMDWLVRGLVAHFYGIPSSRRQSVRARMAAPVKKPKPFERLVRVSLRRDDQGEIVCAPLPSDCGVPAQIAHADGMLVLPIGSEGAQEGQMVEVDLLKPPELIEGF